MKNRSDKEILRAFIKLTEGLKSRGINPGFHLMDNEASTNIDMNMKTMNIKYKLVPQSNHRAKNAERSNQTFKNHFIERICSIDKDFRIKLRYRLLQQATISLNFLRQSRTLPHQSAYTHIYGELNYNHTPLAPPGKIIVINNRPKDRA